MRTPLRRYGLGARWYDVLSGERLVYRVGRADGIRMLAPGPGDVVIDLGCGTGLNFAQLVARVGPSGMVIGVDRSAEMLTAASKRVTANRWRGVRLVAGDAADLDAAVVAAMIREHTGRTAADALLATYALSVFDDRETAWQRARACLRPGARACVVDMQVPTGRWRVLAPLARLACAAGGSDITAAPWLLLGADAVGATRRAEARGGHLVAVAGTLP